jgi:hypothetical protein
VLLHTNKTLNQLQMFYSQWLQMFVNETDFKFVHV